MKTQSRIFLGTTAVIACTLLGAGCAKPKAQAAKTLLNQNKGATAGSGPGGAYDPTLNGIEGAYKLYAPADGLTQPEMKNLVTKYYPNTIDPTMISYLFDEAKGKDQKLTLADITTRIPTLAWAAQGKPIAFADLDANLTKSFPAATKTSRDGVLALVSRYDEKWAGGDEDKKMSQNELLVSGAILGLVQREDFSKGMPARFALSPQLSQLIDRKVNQQLFGRYTVSAYSALPSDDMKLEWVQFMLRKELLTREFKDVKNGEAADADMPALLARWDIKAPAADKDKWVKLYHLYDQSTFFMGNQNGTLNKVEALNLLTDLLFAQATITALDGNVNATGAAKHADKVTSLASLFPKTAPTLMLDAAGHPKSDFWTSLGEGTSEITIVVAQLDAMGIVEFLFAGYDANHDMLLQKSEATTALAALKVTNPAMMSLLYPTDTTALAPSDLFGVILQTEQK